MTETWPRSAAPDPLVPAADQWVAAGPAVTLNGAPAGQPRVTGTVTCLQVSPDGLRVYAGTALGGIWYSGDGGVHWRSLDFYATVKDGSGNLVHSDTAPVGAIAVRFDTEATELVVAGPGIHPAVGRQPASAATARGTGLRAATGPASTVAASGAAAADPWRAEATDQAGLAVAALAFDRVSADIVWAATNKGLLKRPASGAASWQHMDPGLGTGPITWVVVLPGLGAEPERIYVASADGHVARSADGGSTWQPVTLPPHPSAAATVPFERLVLAAGNVPGHAVVWVLAGGPRLWRIDGDTAAVVTGLPADLLTPTGTGAMSITAHPLTDPAHTDMIVVGGGALPYPASTLQARLYLGHVTSVIGTLTFPQTPGAPGQPVTEWVGAGVPAEVGALAFVPGPGPAQLWAGCGAGVFRSVTGGTAGSMTARLTGLASVELNSLAVHPFSDGTLVAGARDLGVLRRAGAETWQVARPGAAGGTGIDPADPGRAYAQSSLAQWNLSVDGGLTFADLGYLTPVPPGTSTATVAAWSAAQSDETAKSALASRIALTAGPGGTQVALGTDRIFYADTAALAAAAGGNSGWVTLPTATDPYDVSKTAPDRGQDGLDGPVLVPRFGDADHLYVLTRTSVYAFTRTAGTWAHAQLYDQVQVHRNWKGKVPSGQIPDDTPLLELAVHQAGKGTLYVGTGGPSGEDHLWWFDGTGQWLPAGLPTDTAVHAITVDPAHPEVVYAGTDLGVWKGTGTFGSGSPTWSWAHYSDGLPEAPCVDLAVFAPPGGTTRLLRGAFAGRGVYEVALDAITQGPEVYLRADTASARRGTVAVGGSRDPVSPVRAQVRLDSSPDIHVWRTPAATPVEPLALPAGPASAPFDVWVLQSALRAAGEDVPTDGRWSAQVAAALAHRASVLGLPGTATPQQVWDAVVAGSTLPYDFTPPDAADLVSHLREEPDRWPKTYQTSCVNGGESGGNTVTARIQVVVHSRHWHPIPATRISVALLKTPYAGRPGLSGCAPLPVGWAASLAADRAAPPGGGWLAGSAWSYADAATPFRAVPAPADPANPQVVTFDADLTGGSWDWPGWVLLAVVVADDDPVTAAETGLARLVRTDRHVAARSIRHAHLPAQPPARFAGMDAAGNPGPAVMAAAWTSSNLSVTGMYLDSPAPVPGEPASPKAHNGHNRTGSILGNPPGSWMAGWGQLHPQWGILIIYWGQQDPANADGPVSLAVPPDIPDLNAADADAKAALANIPKGVVIYLDWEIGGAPNAADLAYCTRWFHSLAERGYRPGVYCHTASSVAFRRECPGLWVWNVNLTAGTPQPGDIQVVNHQLLVRAPAMAAADPVAIARQWMFSLNPPAGNPVAGFPQIDGDSAIAADPAFPERRCQPQAIRTGPAAATSASPAGLAVYAVRRGKPARATWTPGAATADRSLDFSAAPFLWNPFAAVAALRTPASADIMLALGLGTSDPDDVWRLQVIRREAGATAWRQQTLPQGDLGIDPLPGVAASTRGDESIEAFAVDMDAGTLTGARYDPATAAWSALDAPAAPHGPATTPVTRTNRASAVSRAPGQLDLFWVGTDHFIHTSSSSAPGTWTDPVQVGDPAVLVHSLANLCTVSRSPDRIDVLFVGQQTGTTAWRLYDVWWDNGGPGGGWGAPPNSQIVGGIALDVEPMSPIAACARTADHVDAFVTAATGVLLISTFDRVSDTWSALAPIAGQPQFGGQPLKVASVDSAVFLGGAEVGVLVTGRDQTVWATHYDATIPGYTQFERIPPLDPV
jgi:hypothetical protein